MIKRTFSKVLTLFMVLFLVQASCLAEEMVTIPDLEKVEEDVAKQILLSSSFIPVMEYWHDDNIPEGTVIHTNPIAGSEAAKNSKVTVEISKGPRFIEAINSTWYAYWIKGSKEDFYEMLTPSITVGVLEIPFESVTLNSRYKVKYRGIGVASVTDTFNKEIPLTYEFENEDVKKGEPQKITIIIPLDDIETKKPTTIYCKLWIFVNDQYEDLNINFTMSW